MTVKGIVADWVILCKREGLWVWTGIKGGAVMAKSTAVKEIVKSWLIKQGYSGLFHENGCDCVIEDLMSCADDPSLCKAGYLVEDEGEDCWRIGLEKED